MSNEYAYEVSRDINVQDILPLVEPYLVKALNAAKGNIEKLLPVGASGNLRRSLSVSTKQVTDGIIGNIDIAENARNYAYFVEFGRKPGGMPPWNKSDEEMTIYNWVKAQVTGRGKLVGWYNELLAKRTTTTASGKSRVRGGSKTREQIIRGMSFVIARSIKMHGTRQSRLQGPNTGPFARGWNQSSNKFDTIINLGVAKAFEQLSK